MNLKHGMKVTCEICGEKIIDAKISVDVDGKLFICQNKWDGGGVGDKLGYDYSWFIGGNADKLSYPEVTNLKPVKDISDISTYQVGDILVDEDGDKHKVLGICNLIVILSTTNYFKATAGLLYTTQELVKVGYNFEEHKDTLIGKELTKTIKGKKYKVVVKEEIDG